MQTTAGSVVPLRFGLKSKQEFFLYLLEVLMWLAKRHKRFN